MESVGAVFRKSSANTGFWKIAQNSQEITVPEHLFNKVSGIGTCNFIKKRLQQRYVSVNFAVVNNTYFVEYLQIIASK